MMENIKSNMSEAEEEFGENIQLVLAVFGLIMVLLGMFFNHWIWLVGGIFIILRFGTDIEITIKNGENE